MNTKCVPATDESVELAAEMILCGMVVAFPTETVYGLGANALDDGAVKKIFAAKDRPQDNPLITHVGSQDAIGALIEGPMPEAARKLADAFWPGPLTMIMKSAGAVAPSVSPGLNTVSIRMPSHPVARALLDACRVPIAAPSANRSGRPSPTSAAHVMEDMDGVIPLILDGGDCVVGLESTVLDVTCEPPRILRPGGITPEMVAAVIGEVDVDESVLKPLAEGQQAASPGMKYRHYAPQGALTLVTGPEAKMTSRIAALYDEAATAERRCCILALDGRTDLYGARATLPLGATEDEAARRLFGALREMDARGMETILVEAFEARGVGLALMNRLARAAGFHIIDAEDDACGAL